MPVYLDHAATTPLRREALDAMLPWLTDGFGNPSSIHATGRRARAALDDSRERVAAAFNAEPREIIFTGGGTEAINLALKGVAWAGKARGNRLVTTAVEHHATMYALRHLEKFGFEIVFVPVDRYGRVDPEALEAEINDRTTLVSLILASNEIGTIQPLADLVRIVRAHAGVALHVDAVQAPAYMPLDTREMDVDLLSIASHKFEGPKGVGALYLRHGTIVLPQLQGGSQERYRRAGTENVAGIVGMARALELAVAERSETGPRVARLRDRLRDTLMGLGDVELTGHPRKRLPSLLSLIVGGADGATIVSNLDLAGIECSTGAACTTGSTEPSHVLTAMGYPEEEARGALRLSLGRTTTDEDIDRAAEFIPAVIERIRAATSQMVPDAASVVARA